MATAGIFGAGEFRKKVKQVHESNRAVQHRTMEHG